MVEHSQQSAIDPTALTLSVVVPVYNEYEVLPEFHRRLQAVLKASGADYEILYVNDGSSDPTLAIIQRLQSQDSNVAWIDLSRNFGKEIALTAGLDHAHGDAVIVIDADLQDPPELIPELLAVWQQGYDVVYAKRSERQGETWLKRTTARGFYYLMHKLTHTPIPQNTGDYRLLSRRAVDALSTLRERHRFMKGLFTWIGFPQKEVLYQRHPRHAGATKWNYWRLWNFALDGVTSFSTLPLKFASYLGFMFALCAFLFGIWIIAKTLLFGDPVPGYPSLMVVILFLGGVQLLFIGVLGEYLGRMFDETKQRPLYFINAYQRRSINSRTPINTSSAMSRLPSAVGCNRSKNNAAGPPP